MLHKVAGYYYLLLIQPSLGYCSMFLNIYYSIAIHTCICKFYNSLYLERGDQNSQNGSISATILVPGETNLFAPLVPGGLLWGKGGANLI